MDNIKIKVIGLGGYGGGVVNYLSGVIENAEFFAIDRNPRAFGNYHPSVRTIHLNPRCSPAEEGLFTPLSNTDLAFVVAGIGGNTSGRLLPDIIDFLRSTEALTIAVLLKPLNLEERQKEKDLSLVRQKIEQSIDALLYIPNEHTVLETIQKTLGQINTGFPDIPFIIYHLIASVVDAVIPSCEKDFGTLDYHVFRQVFRNRGVADWITIGNEASFLHSVSESLKDVPDLVNSFNKARDLLVSVTIDRTKGQNILLSELSETMEFLHQKIPAAEFHLGIAVREISALKAQMTLIGTGR